MSGRRSTAELLPHEALRQRYGAEDGIRTRGLLSGAEDGIRTRDLLHGKQMLYQLSYFRICTISGTPIAPENEAAYANVTCVSMFPVTTGRGEGNATKKTIGRGLDTKGVEQNLLMVNF